MKCYTGDGLLNSAINKLPFEMHLPGYNWCGPGTKVQKRLARNDAGVNGLDEACKEHDIAYSTNKDLSNRHQADKVLAQKALTRFRANDASWKEKMAALGVAGAMKAKVKLGMGFNDPQLKSVLSNLLKTKQQLETSVRNIEGSIKILQQNGRKKTTTTKQKSNEKTKRSDNMIKKIREKTRRKQQQQQDGEDMDIDIVDYPIRKRKQNDLSVISNKRLREDPKIITQRKITPHRRRQTTKRKLDDDEEEDKCAKREKLDLDEPIILPNRKRKFDDDSSGIPEKIHKLI